MIVDEEADISCKRSIPLADDAAFAKAFRETTNTQQKQQLHYINLNNICFILAKVISHGSWYAYLQGCSCSYIHKGPEVKSISSELVSIDYIKSSRVSDLE